MTSKENTFVSIKDATIITGKSESTIKRLVRKTKKETPSVIQNNKYFKFETLPSGIEKIYVSKTFLKKHFVLIDDPVNNRSRERSSDPVKKPDNQAFIDHLLKELEDAKNELKEKDHRIESLLDKQMENVDKLLTLQDQSQKLQALQMESSKERKGFFQRLLNK
jgi:peptidoglycan hydrolase CwlO-like protein